MNMNFMRNARKKRMERSRARFLCALLLLTSMAPVIAQSGSATDSSNDDRSTRAVSDHLLLSEICVTPTEGEFIEIHNPKDVPVVLDDHYIADFTTYYNIVNSSLLSPHHTDFVAGFPPRSSIDARAYLIVAFSGTDFRNTYSEEANFELRDDSSLPNMVDVDIGASAGFTDGGETVVLFHWDGVGDLVDDVDIVWWGGVGNRVNKTGKSIDSDTDGDASETVYRDEDAVTHPMDSGAHGGGDSFKRINTTEPGESKASGNGIAGHDETSENLTASWSHNTSADPTVSKPIIYEVVQLPDGNPAPGTDVVIEANITSDASVKGVNITVSVGDGGATTYGMTNVGGNIYSHKIEYNSPAMSVGTEVTYNITATDNDENATVTADYGYVYTNNTELSMQITEVMYDDDDGDDWVELYCADDGNPDGPGYITGWSVDDMDGSDKDKVLGNVSVNTGDVVMIRYNDDVTPDESNSSDGNGDGVIDLYSDSSNNRLTKQGDQIVLYDDGSEKVDSVAWSFNDTLSSSTEIDDMTELYEDGQWVSPDNSSCVDSENITEGWSIARSKGEKDTNSKIDWHVLEDPEPGIHRNLSVDIPRISDIRLDPEPIEGQVAPGTDITVTARITDQQGIVRAQINWSLNGTPRENITLNDNGTGNDVTGDDDNWTGVIPGQSDGSAIEFFIKASDGIEYRTSKTFRIRFTEPPKEPRLMISEVMFDPSEGDNWIEIFCEEDGNDTGGKNIAGWYVHDLDGDIKHRFDNTTVETGEYLILHFNNDSAGENNSGEGNGDGIVDVYTTSGNRGLSSGGDQAALFDEEGHAVDAVAWQEGGTLGKNDITDLVDLFDEKAWNSSEIESCINVSALTEGESLARKYDHGVDEYYDTDSKNDWYLDDGPTPGKGGHSPPPEFRFTVLDEENATADDGFEITWSWEEGRGSEEVNVSLFYHPDNLTAPAEFIAELTPWQESYEWDTSGIPNGTYYLSVRIDDSINTPFPVNSSYPLDILHLPVLPPEVVSTVPRAGAPSVEVPSDIEITFDRAMDLASVKIGETLTADPALAGDISLKGEMTVVFSPEDMEYNTTYSVTVKDVLSDRGGKLRDPFTFSFRTEPEPLYLLAASLEPANATVTVTVDTVGGEEVYSGEGDISIMLPNGTYYLLVSAPGYDDRSESVTIAGADEDLGEIRLEETTYEVRIGRFVDAEGNGIGGILVEFSYNEEEYSEATDSRGYAVFSDFPAEDIPGDTEITMSYGDEKLTKPYSEITFDEFAEETEAGDDDDGEKTPVKEKSNTGLWIVLIVLIVLILGVGVAMAIYIMRGRAGEEAEEGGGVGLAERSVEATDVRGPEEGQPVMENTGEEREAVTSEEIEGVPGVPEAERAGEGMGEVTGEKPGEVSEEVPGEVSGEKPGEVSGEKPGEVSGEKAGEVTGEKAGEMPGEEGEVDKVTPDLVGGDGQEGLVGEEERGKGVGGEANGVVPGREEGGTEAKRTKGVMRPLSERTGPGGGVGGESENIPALTAAESPAEVPKLADGAERTAVSGGGRGGGGAGAKISGEDLLDEEA